MIFPVSYCFVLYSFIRPFSSATGFYEFSLLAHLLPLGKNFAGASFILFGVIYGLVGTSSILDGRSFTLDGGSFTLDGGSFTLDGGSYGFSGTFVKMGRWTDIDMLKDLPLESCRMIVRGIEGAVGTMVTMVTKEGYGSCPARKR